MPSQEREVPVLDVPPELLKNKSNRWVPRLKRGSILWISAVIAVLAGLRLAQSAAALVELGQLDYYEGIVYDNAARILRNEMLYEPMDRAPYVVSAYMPMYPVLAAALRAVLGDGFGPGRALSLGAGLLTACLVGRMTAMRLERRGPGAFAGCLFLALSFPGVFPWMAMYRVDMLGVAFAVSSIAVLESEPTSRRTVTAAVLASLAILTKQLLFGASLAAVLWLLPRNRRQAVLFGSVVAAIVGVTCAAFEFWTHAFFANTVYSNLNPMRGDVLLANVEIYFTFQAGPLVAALIYLLRQGPRQRNRDLLVLYWIASWLPLIAMAKVGAYHNYWIENAAISAVLATLGVWSAAEAASRFRPALGAIAVGLCVAGPVVLVTESLAVSQLWTAPARNASLQNVIARVRSEPSDVIAEPYDAVVLAGRPVLMETVIFSILYQSGRWDPRPLVQRICSGQIGLLILNRPIDVAEGFSFYDVYWWPQPVIHGLRKVMQLEDVDGGRYIYTPRQDLVTADCP